MNMTIFSNTVFLDFIKGPMVWLSFIIFGLGLIVQTIRLLKLTRIKEARRFAPDAAIVPQTDLSKWERFTRYFAFLRITVLGANACLVLVSFIFHVCLVITPIFVLGHNVLLDTSFGISLVSFPEQISDILTKFVIAGGLLFFMRRLFLRRVRMISTVNDFILLFVAVAPFLTGFLAYHHIFNYNIMIVLHILCGELMLMLIPFSKFFHMVFFFISRFMIVSEHSLGSPKRSWQY
ncbi:MAG: hypothetical protein J7K96_00190 [Desulfobacteraceae bacterium]|nr:hypothetical protein [Desulfobacteraceae bacterium]